MSVDWNSTEIIKWKEEATKEQQEYYELLGSRTWIKFEPSDYSNLKRNIGYAIYGPPDGEPNEISNDNTGYSQKKLKHINEVFDVIKELKMECGDQVIQASFLLMSGKIGDEHVKIPVIRVLDKNKNIFIDTCPRVYKNWQDYLENNKLPECVLCYPRNGVYSAWRGVVQVDFRISPAGDTKMKVLQGFDIAQTVSGIVALGVAITGMIIPVIMPITIGASVLMISSGGYSAGRSIQTLVDRAEHMQSIGLDSPEARNCWLGVGGSVMSIVSGGTFAVAAKMVQTGETVALAGQIAMKSVTASSCILNGIGVVNGLANIIVKAVEEDDVSALDIYQFISSVLFFTGSVISTHQAHTLINSIGRSGEGNLYTMMSQISKFVKETTNTGVTQLANCESLTGFVIGSSSMMTSVSHVQRGFCDMCKWVCRKLVEVTKSLMKGLITMTKYIMEAGELLERLWVSWNEEITEVMNKVCQAFGVKHWSDIVIKGCNIMRGVEPGIIREIADTIISERRSIGNHEITAKPFGESQVIPEDGGNTSHNIGANSFVHEKTQPALSYDDITNIHAKFAKLQECKDSVKFLHYLKFACNFVRSEFDEKKKNYEKTWNIVLKFNKNASKEDFDQSYGISGNQYQHFFEEVLKMFKDNETEGFFRLKLAYDSQNSCSSAQENPGQSFFEMDDTTVHPFYNKTGRGPNGMLSKEQYHELAAELTKQDANENNVSLVEDGSITFIQINDGAAVILVKSDLEDGKVSGIATITKNS